MRKLCFMNLTRIIFSLHLRSGKSHLLHPEGGWSFGSTHPPLARPFLLPHHYVFYTIQFLACFSTITWRSANLLPILQTVEAYCQKYWWKCLMHNPYHEWVSRSIAPKNLPPRVRFLGLAAPDLPNPIKLHFPSGRMASMRLQSPWESHPPMIWHSFLLLSSTFPN